MNEKLKQVGILLFMVGMLTSCRPTGPTATPTLPGESLEWEKVADDWGVGHLYREREPKMVIVRDSTETSLLKGQIYPMYLKGIDFNTRFAIVVYQGERMTTGYSVEVLDIRQDESMIAVYTRFLTPPTPAPGEIVGVGEMVTSPYCVLRITKTPQLKGDFIFVLIADGKEISRQQHFIP